MLSRVWVEIIYLLFIRNGKNQTMLVKGTPLAPFTNMIQI